MQSWQHYAPDSDLPASSDRQADAPDTFFPEPCAYTLYIEAEQNDIPVFYNVILALHSDDSFFPRRGKASVVEKVLIVDHLCLDKSTLKIGVDLAGSLRCLCALFDGPCTALILSSGS
jgi:hypothetical protein